MCVCVCVCVCANSVILSVMETSAPLTTVYISFSVCVCVSFPFPLSQPISLFLSLSVHLWSECVCVCVCVCLKAQGEDGWFRLRCSLHRTSTGNGSLSQTSGGYVWCVYWSNCVLYFRKHPLIYLCLCAYTGYRLHLVFPETPIFSKYLCACL